MSKGPSRREFLTALLAGTVAACGSSGGGARARGEGRPSSPTSSRSPVEGPALPGGVFALGVASGDPTADGAVLWTRLAPEPTAGGGMPAVPVPVGWQVAADPGFDRVLAAGTVEALPDFGHCVHVDLSGLEPDGWYWYRFLAGGRLSPVGRTRTLPRPGSRPGALRFAHASCQNYKQGYWTAYPHLAAEDLDLVFFLGDYIYESGFKSDTDVRDHEGPEVVSLGDYRNRYGLYKSDAGLRAAHAAFPWIVTWDDHEVDNNYAGLVPQDDQAPEAFAERRAAAYRAYYEHMPLRLPPPVGPDFRIHRSFDWGDLASFFVADTRQYRSDQPCDDEITPFCRDRLDPAATMLGAEQEAWLLDGLARTRATWSILAQQVQMSSFDFGGIAPNPDAWDGYAAARQRLLDAVRTDGTRNFVVLTGDIHSSIVADLGAVPGDPRSPLAGSELVVTSISSGGDRPAIIGVAESVLADAVPNIHYANFRERGYVRVELTPERLTADYRLVESVRVPSSPIRTTARFRIDEGRPGVRRGDLVS